MAGGYSIACRGVCLVLFGETIHYLDKVDEFQLAFVENVTDS